MNIGGPQTELASAWREQDPALAVDLLQLFGNTACAIWRVVVDDDQLKREASAFAFADNQPGDERKVSCSL